MANPLLPADPKQRRKLLIYAGLAGALLLIVVLSRRGSEQATTQPDPGLQAVSSPAPTDAGLTDSGGGIDNSAQLASFETALLDQLPAAVESGINAGLANGIPAPAPAAGTTVINIGAGPTAGKPGPTVKPTPHPAANTLFAGHPLTWWKTRRKKVKGHWKYAWPSAPGKFVHTRPFAGHH